MNSKKILTEAMMTVNVDWLFQCCVRSPGSDNSKSVWAKIMVSTWKYQSIKFIIYAIIVPQNCTTSKVEHLLFMQENIQ